MISKDFEELRILISLKRMPDPIVGPKQVIPRLLKEQNAERNPDF